MMHYFYPIILSGLFLGGILPSLFAQEDTLSGDRLHLSDLKAVASEDLINREISVASRNSESIQTASGVVSLITASEIEYFGGNNLLEVIERVASIYYLGSYLTPNNVISIRGDLNTTYSNHVLILLNGRPTRESMYGGLDFSIFLAFPLSSIERIEVIRGPGSVLYGTNAYAGVLNIITKDALEDETNFSVEYGSFNSTGFTISNSKVKDRLRVTSGIKYFNQQGWEVEAIGESFGGDIDTLSYSAEQDNIGGVVNIDYKDQITFNSLVTYSAQHNTGALPVTHYPGDSSQVDAFRNRRITALRSLFDFGYKYHISSYSMLTLNATYNVLNGRYSHPNGDFIARTQDLLLEASLQSSFDEWNITGGATGYWQRGEAEIGDGDDQGVPDYSEIWYSAYGQIDYSVPFYSEENILKFIAGAQFNRTHGIKGNFVPRVGMVGRFKKWGAKLLYGQAFRAAFEAENHLNDSPLLKGDPNIRPEKVTTWDMQLSYSGDRLQAIATYFKSAQKDIIIQRLQTRGDFEYLYQNAGTIEAQGFEFEVKAAPFSHFFLTGSFTYQTNKKDTIDNPTYMPEWMAKLGAFYDWKRKGVSLGVFSSYFGEAGQIPGAEIVNPSADAFNFLTANLNVKVDDLLNLHENNQDEESPFQVLLSLYVKNILDTPVYYPEFVRGIINTFPGRPGRAFYVSVKVNF